MLNNTNTAIPFLDLVGVHQEMQAELVSVFQKSLSMAAFVGGPAVEEFEQRFAQFCGASHCVGVASGTDAVRFALMAAGIKPGDVVVTVPNTFIATTEAITQAGAHPDFVDIDERTYCMDPAKLQQYIARNCIVDERSGRLINRKYGAPVTAIVPVHLYGQVADMDTVLQLAHEHKLIVIEDACQAHGAEYFSKKDGAWIKAGSMGKAAAFSFYPGKNLGACGEAGAITTNNESMARTMRMLRDHGQAQKYHHEIEGYNGRLDALQAGLLTAKLRRLDEWNGKRRECARHYDELLSSVDGVTTPFCPEWVRAVYHLYVVRVKDRDTIQKQLANSGIGTAIHYPVPLHLQRAYRHLGFNKGDFPIAEKVAAEILSLPMYPQLNVDQIRRVVRAMANAVTPDRVTVAAERQPAQTPAQV
jgi:dTDP-4-amino-4,6-dideoxygalactose transaminase